MNANAGTILTTAIENLKGPFSYNTMQYNFYDGGMVHMVSLIYPYATKNMKELNVLRLQIQHILRGTLSQKEIISEYGTVPSKVSRTFSKIIDLYSPVLVNFPRLSAVDRTEVTDEENKTMQVKTYKHGILVPNKSIAEMVKVQNDLPFHMPYRSIEQLLHS